jgi:hypothetical protein
MFALELERNIAANILRTSSASAFSIGYVSVRTGSSPCCSADGASGAAVCADANVLISEMNDAAKTVRVRLTMDFPPIVRLISE